MIPTRSLLLIASAWAVIGLAASIWPSLYAAWMIGGVVLGLVAMVDGVRASRVSGLVVKRVAPPVMPVHREREIKLLFDGASRPMTVRCFDYFVGGNAHARGLPQTFQIDEDQQITVGYGLRATLREWLSFESVRLQVRSHWGLWWRRESIELAEQVRVLPDFSASADHRTELDAKIRSQAGLRLSRKRGGGTEFHQLRDYRDGDSQARIDWKSTARHGRLISRDYESERGQQILLVLDTSRRMRSMDDGLAHFDACLMAALQLAHVALDRGDAVGFLTFGGTERWMAPGRAGAAETMLNQLFDVQPTLEPPDYLRAAERILVRQRRRALLVMVTNLRDEDSDEFEPAAQLLTRRHLLLVASLREKLLDADSDQPLNTPDDALIWLSTQHYLRRRERAHARLRQQFPHIVDAPANRLAPAMIGQYLQIKQAGEL